jgi:hypothetical protein
MYTSPTQPHANSETSRFLNGTIYQSFLELRLLARNNNLWDKLARNDSQTSDTGNWQQNQTDANSEEEDDSGTQQRRRKQNRQTTGAAFGGAIQELIDAFAPPDQSQNTTKSQIPDQIVSRVVKVFQDGLAHELSMEELVCGFSVLENPSKA